MNDPLGNPADSAPQHVRSHIELLCRDFERAWLAGASPKVEDFVEKIQLEWQHLATGILVSLEIRLQASNGAPVDIEALHRRFVGHGDLIDREVLDLQKSTGETAETQSLVSCPVGDFELPKEIGRYTVMEVLGKGGFGVVCLGHDKELGRSVALKFSKQGPGLSDADVNEFIQEAKTAAQLDHPAIVPVYDVLRLDHWLCIVQRFIDGQTLQAELKQRGLSVARTVSVLATIAEGIGFAHQRGFIHRDLKPSNILLDKDGKPLIGDFGLAIHESIQRQQKGETRGTPLYMSPEQVRGETHRMDGRSDIFSLGVMLYQMLTGALPFGGASRSELYDEIKNREPRPLRQIKPDLSPELERICLKCLAKRISDRYQTANDLVADLNRMSRPDSVELPGTVDDPVAESVVVPRGLRSFGKSDADFFLRLLPGPFDRNGLPEIISFWKGIIDSTDEQNAIPVGLIYGPSGCGKSSLVKAGLLPRAADHVVTLYVEATREDTDSRLRLTLKRQFHGIPEQMTLPEIVESIRRGKWLKSGQKLVIVIDQFEQWLHLRQDVPGSELVDALRHCDGVRIQTVLMVRDDFWLATSRFFRAIEVELLDGHNTSLVDLFDKLHARRVLAEFGRAYGRLPASETGYSVQQNRFLDQAIDALADGDRVICVQLAIFSEMVKSKPWVVETLSHVGGATGVGVAFLEETFVGKSAKPERRIHEKAARAVLDALVPDVGSEIRGQMKTWEELKQVSGYAQRFDDFKDLMRILAGELRLVTLSDPETMDQSDTGRGSDSSGESFYQLTHDFLVRPLRQWLEKKQKSTMRGRATIRLRENASIWNSHPVNSYLPSPAGFVNTRLMTNSATWSAAERKLMKRATWYYGIRSLIVLVSILVSLFVVREMVGRANSNVLVERLLESSTNDVPNLFDEVQSHARWIKPGLASALEDVQANPSGNPSVDRRRILNLYLAMHRDPFYEQRLVEWVADAEPQVLGVIAATLQSHASELEPVLLENAGAKNTDRNSRLRYLAVLAQWDANPEKWTGIADDLVAMLLAQSSISIGTWIDLFEPVGNCLLESLSSRISSASGGDEFARAVGVFGEYLKAYPEGIAHTRRLIPELNSKLIDSYAPVERDEAIWLACMLAKESAYETSLLDRFSRSLETSLPEASFTGWMKSARNAKSRIANAMEGACNRIRMKLELSNAVHADTAQALANVVVAQNWLERANADWSWLGSQSDLTTRSFLIEKICMLEDSAELVLNRLKLETDASIRAALLLSLGNCAANLRTGNTGPEAEILSLYLNDPDSAVHSSAEWLLRKIRPEIDFDKLLAGSSGAGTSEAGWRRNPLGLNMMRIHLPDVYQSSRGNSVQGDYDYEVSSIEIPLFLFQKFSPDFSYDATLWLHTSGYDSPVDAPVVNITWCQAAAFCNWLSQQEGIPVSEWCYVPNEDGEYDVGMRLAENWSTCRGYRLPTLAEWEFASQTDSPLAWTCGRDQQMVANYSWCRESNGGKAYCRGGGQLKPNRLGLFDMQGNAEEMLLEPLDGLSHPIVVGELASFAIRGGVVWKTASDLCSGESHTSATFGSTSDVTGFRVARRVD